MKRALVLLCLLLSCLASAAKFTTSRYDVAISIAKRGDVTLTETISVVFTERQHGLILKKPFRTRSEDGKVRQVNYELLDATIQRGQSPQKVESRAVNKGGDWEVRLGSANEWVSGAATYRITYLVKGAMTPIHKADSLGTRTELLWNLLPTNWPTAIPASTMTVTYPSPQAGRLIARVLAGPRKTRQGIQVEYDGPRQGRSEFIEVEFPAKTQLRVTLKKPLPESYVVTAVLGLPGDTVEAPDPLIYSERNSSTRPTAGLYDVTDKIGTGSPLLGIIPFLPGVLVFFLSRKRWPAPEKPLVVKFDPPPGIGPSLAGTVIDQEVNQHDIVAGIVSMAQKGAVRLHHPTEEVAGVTIELIGLQRAKGLDQVEEYLYSALAQYGPWISPEMLRGTFGASYRMASNILLTEARSKYLLTEGGPAKNSLGCVLWLLTFIAALGLCLFTPLSLLGGLAGLVLGSIGIARTTTLTSTGQDVRRELQGLKEFIVRAQEQELNYMANVMPNQALFERLLPYAVAFNSVKQWTRAFEGINIQMPDWYEAPMGSDVFWTAMLLNDLTSAQHDYGQAMTYTEPTTSFDSGSGFSSGDSGFGGSWSDSGGGGFDGGSSGGDGGGGGGGDSW